TPSNVLSLPTRRSSDLVFWKGGHEADPTSWTNENNWLYEDGSVAGTPGAITEVVLSAPNASGQGQMSLNQDMTIKKLTVTDSNRSEEHTSELQSRVDLV